jgi:predicted methyltransferase MtxX (methanogen marker protein 4)
VKAAVAHEAAAITRPHTPADLQQWPTAPRITLVESSYDAASLAAACCGATCGVSVLSGLKEVMLVQHGALLKAAVNSGVTRFIPSDVALDDAKTTPCKIRCMDLRRSFHSRLDAALICATAVLNGHAR